MSYSVELVELLTQVLHRLHVPTAPAICGRALNLSAHNYIELTPYGYMEVTRYGYRKLGISVLRTTLQLLFLFFFEFSHASNLLALSRLGEHAKLTATFNCSSVTVLATRVSENGQEPPRKTNILAVWSLLDCLYLRTRRAFSFDRVPSCCPVPTRCPPTHWPDAPS